METESESTLKKLYNASIFQILLNKEKDTLQFIECCDYYYETHLTKEELGILIGELTIIYRDMI